MDSRAFIACLALFAMPAAGSDIYKCVDGGATVYQSMPCARGQRETSIRVAGAVAKAERDQPVATSAAVSPSRKRGPWTRTAVEVGISDDEVLNMPGWGRPAHISRARVGRGWEEVWRYGNGFGGELRFVNARLAEIVQT